MPFKSLLLLCSRLLKVNLYFAIVQRSETDPLTRRCGPAVSRPTGGSDSETRAGPRRGPRAVTLYGPEPGPGWSGHLAEAGGEP